MTKSVYIHIPFCANICSYCDFAKMYYNDSLASKYLDALEKEIKNNYQGEMIETLYIGGGTPSALSYSNLKRLFQIIKIFKLSRDIEFSMEVNPENIDEEKLILMKENSVNRISIGIESTDDKILTFLNRNHNFEMVKEKIELMHKLGFTNINVDLIYAVPNQTIKMLEKDLDLVTKLPITHISLYSLMINSHTKLDIDNVSNISEDLDYEMYNFIRKYLKQKGFNHYEISNFGKDGYESRHNLVYWHNEHYYGFGLGASGYINNIRYENTKSISKYLEGNYLLSEECLTKEDEISYELILGFRLINGINKEQFYKKYKIPLESLFNIQELIKDKYLEEKSGNIMISYDKIYVENSILINFL